jgi:hypothetical protein
MFNDTLIIAVLLNTRVTREVMMLASSMKERKLKKF